MAGSQQSISSITLGQGGRIMDCELLEELEGTPILPPGDVLKLAIYYAMSLTNKDLASFLWGKGTASMITHPGVAPVIMQDLALNPLTYESSYEEALEFFDPWEDDNDSPQMSVPGRDKEIDDQSFLFVPICDMHLGLLIEKHRLKNGKFAFWVLNIAPDLKTLSEPKASAPAPSN